MFKENVKFCNQGSSGREKREKWGSKKGKTTMEKVKCAVRPWFHIRFHIIGGRFKVWNIIEWWENGKVRTFWGIHKKFAQSFSCFGHFLSQLSKAWGRFFSNIMCFLKGPNFIWKFCFLWSLQKYKNYASDFLGRSEFD